MRYQAVSKESDEINTFMDLDAQEPVYTIPIFKV